MVTLTFQKPNGTIFIIAVPEGSVGSSIANYTGKGFILITEGQHKPKSKKRKGE